MENFIRQNYARGFINNGFENTHFLGMLTERDLKRLGIKKLAHRKILCRMIEDIPDFIIPVTVPVRNYNYQFLSVTVCILINNQIHYKSIAVSVEL